MITITSDKGAIVNLDSIAYFVKQEDGSFRLVDGNGYFEHRVSGERAKDLRFFLLINQFDPKYRFTATEIDESDKD